MLTTKYLFEIPVYRLCESEYHKKLTDYKNCINSKTSMPMSDVYLYKQFGGDWRYNEIIGFLRFYRYGENQIRCDYAETDAIKKTRTRKKLFEKVSDSYCCVPFSKLSLNTELAKIMRSSVEHCENRLRKQNRVLDKELFENTVDFIDWKSLLKYSHKGTLSTIKKTE